MMEASETSETFGQGVEDPNDDPFAGSDFGDFGQEESTLPAEETAPADIPTVNAEGERIDPPTSASQPAQPAAEAATPTDSQPSAPSAPAASAEAPAAESASVAEPAPEFEVVDPQPAAQPAVDASATPADAPATEAASSAEEPVDESRVVGEPKHSIATTADGSPAEAQGAGVDPQPVPSAEEQTAPTAEPSAPDATPSDTASGTSIASPPASDPEATTAVGGSEPITEGTPAPVDPDEAAPPAEIKDKKGRVTHRRYVILRVVGANEFKLVQWYEDKAGKMVPRGQGAKRQKFALARDNEAALHIGYAAVGAPEDGANLVAVAESLFQPKMVLPDEPEPAKRKLKIV